ncbi:DNA repair helicase [Thermofilum adornatum 1505]|uniref:DNA repair helicase n=1 Tax=Thermofilum adornatum 1505 TaxID=697581 RepID=A0A3G1A7Z6_9CREN|nr:ATP-dependent DNA helicase [Thermofilum adornatum]AJB42255.1 DNA repair helicase [Thermofilum adornatum 1505]
MSLSKYKFPYKPRPRQLEVASEIQETLKTANVILEAPTGFGKTPVVIYSLLPFLDRGGRIVWAVRTGNETDRPIEEFRVFREKSNARFIAMSFRGKKDMCLLAKEFGETLDYSEVSYICSRERKRCPYYKRLEEGVDYSTLLSRGVLTYSEVYEWARKKKVCPYFLQRELLKVADVVSLSYNYVVDENLSWTIKGAFPLSQSILVVDEAHNLTQLNLGGDTVTEGTIERAKREAEELEARDMAEFIDKIQENVEKEFSSLGEEESQVFSPLKLIDGREEMIEKMKTLGEEVRDMRFREGKRPHSSLYHLANFLEEAISYEGEKGVALIAEKIDGKIHLNIWDMRSSEILSNVWKKFRRVIFMSGTLSPIEAFAETIGVKNYKPISVPSPYDETNASVYIVKDLTTRGEELSQEMARKYVEAIGKVLERVKGNTAVFTASYRIQLKLLEAGLRETSQQKGYQVFVEKREMSGQEAGEVLQEFKKLADEGKGLLVAPMGGRFAEGIDLPGKELVCVFLAGIPFEKPTVKTNLYISYYEELYGEGKGRLYAYIYPALRKASQAIGRALRSPRDQAVIILGDHRYNNYLPLLPDYVRELRQEISHTKLDHIQPPWERIRL